MTYPGVSAEENPDLAAVEERRREREEEMGTYRATQDIPWGNVLAFTAGSPVNKSTVESRGWLEMGLVERVGDENAQTETPAPETVTPPAPAEVTPPPATGTSPNEGDAPAVKASSKKAGSN